MHPHRYRLILQHPTRRRQRLRRKFRQHRKLLFRLRYQRPQSRGDFHAGFPGTGNTYSYAVFIDIAVHCHFHALRLSL